MTTNTTPGAEPVPHGVTPTPWRILFEHDTHKVRRDARGRILGPVSLPFEDYQHACDCVNQHTRLLADREKLRKALEAAVDRMEAVSRGIPVENRAEGVSQATHVRHMAGHLAQHAKIARAALKETEGQ